MNLKRAALFGLLTYVLAAIAGTTFNLLSGTPFVDSGQIPLNLWYFGMGSAAILSFFCAYLYFKGTVTRSAKEGALVGLIFILVSSVLDLAVLLVSLLDQESRAATMALMANYYTHPLFWLTMALVLFATILAGSYTASTTRRSSRKPIGQKSAAKKRKR